MTYNEIEQLINLFRSLAPEALLYEPDAMKMGQIVHRNFMIFDGPGDKAEKIAAMGIVYNSHDDSGSVTLVIGWDKLEFIESVERCRFVIDTWIRKEVTDSGLLTSVPSSTAANSSITD